MLITQWLVNCALTFATATFSQHIQYQLTPAFEQPVGLHDPEPSKDPLFSLHKSLVNIESISGNEQAIAAFLEVYLTSHNYTVERQYLHPLPGSLQAPQAGEFSEQNHRFNLLAYPGENRQTPVLLSSVSTLSEQSSPFPYRLWALHVCCGDK